MANGKFEIESLILPAVLAGGLVAVVFFKDQIVEFITQFGGGIISDGDGDSNGDGEKPEPKPDDKEKKEEKEAPPVPTGAKNSDGIIIPYKMTGKNTKLNVGGKHENGDRYNANHSFKNYYVVAYYKTSSGQELLEMKTDGPNHSGCSSLPKCMWAEPAFELKGGKSHISSEYPHPKNHSDVTKGFEFKTISGNWGGKWIGYGVAAYYNKDGYRVYDQWVDTGGLPNGKPANKWVRTIHGVNTGQLMPNAKRSLPTGGKGLEAEIRCHGGHGTSMKFGKIIEISQPTTSNRAYYNAYNLDRITVPY
jgi:hypothetical protein